MKRLFSTRKPSLWTKTIVTAALSVSLLVPAVYAAPVEPSAALAPKVLNAENATAFLNDFFASEQIKSQYVGASVVIVKDGKTVAQRGYGLADLETKKPIDPASSVFRIASVSKTFTAAAVMQLVEQGKIGLQDDFTKYVKDLKFDNPFGKPVTIENLLTHTTGFEIRDPQPEDIHTDIGKVVEIEDYVRGHMPSVVREPGSAYMYDNFASMLLGLIVQKVSSLPFNDYMEQHIFKPLHMDSSHFLLNNKLKENLVSEYDVMNSKHELYAVSPTVMPQGGMFSTAEDIGKFMISFLNGGSTESGRILKQATVDSMETYRSTIHPLMPNTTYGFEAPIQLPGAGSSSSVIAKLGDIVGTSSIMFLIPEQKTGVFITYNKLGPLRDFFYQAFINTFFPAYAEPAKLDSFTPYTSNQLEKFIGIYTDLRVGQLNTSIEADDKGNLMISDAFLGPRVLKQVDNNLFVDSLTGKFTAFAIGAGDEVLYLKEPYLNPLGYGMKHKAPTLFADIAKDHPYEKAIYTLKVLGHYSDNGDEKFNPEQSVTRGQFVKHLMEISGLKGSSTEELVFTDLKGHSAAAFVHQAYELGLVKGTTTNRFEPDRNITRQEAAVMMWRVFAQQYPAELFESVKLSGETDVWALPAVKMIVKLGIYGPEVQETEKGVFNYASKKVLNRQEESAILYSLLTRPLDVIVSEFMQQK
ncbi:serine hydrolase [Bacillus sp. FJAT-28004]|uniref:serine hydrolase n=1 Tax=Bacillus sp. FJAT-28004 TaxID=1679165 RepID=UPI0006B4618E|nr:serine hydrolase [Bacillus sp. FJAT-28004]